MTVLANISQTGCDLYQDMSFSFYSSCLLKLTYINLQHHKWYGKGDSRFFTNTYVIHVHSIQCLQTQSMFLILP